MMQTIQYWYGIVYLTTCKVVGHPLASTIFQALDDTHTLMNTIRSVLS